MIITMTSLLPSAYLDTLLISDSDTLGAGHAAALLLGHAGALLSMTTWSVGCHDDIVLVTIPGTAHPLLSTVLSVTTTLTCSPAREAKVEANIDPGVGVETKVAKP